MFSCGNLRKRYHLKDPGVDGTIILRWIFSKWDVGIWIGSIWLGKGTGGGNELSGSIECGEFLNYEGWNFNSGKLFIYN